MEACQYTQVAPLRDSKTETAQSWKPLMKQLLVCSSVWSAFFQLGLCVGMPTVFIPQLRRGNFSEVITDDMASWLSSAFNYGVVPWAVVLPIMAHVLGRRASFLFASLVTLSGFLSLHYSRTYWQLLASDLLLGIICACQTNVSLMIITEYSSPKYRGIFLTIKSATGFWGIWVANAIGTFYYWKNIILVGIACCVYNILLMVVWPESPYWLVERGRMQQARAAHAFLKGDDENSLQELNNFIRLRAVNLNSKKTNSIRKFFNAVCSKSFYKPVSLCVMTMALFQFSGKLVFSVYAIDIIRKITNSESTAYTGMLILDGISVLGMYVGCGLSRFMSRRTLLFSTTWSGIGFLLLMSLYLYLISLSVISENAYVSIALLMAFSMCISCGPMILATSLCGELLPLTLRSFASSISSLSGNVLIATTLKLAPLVFSTFKMHGGFLFYAVTSAICTAVLYKYLPETKDKTLQEIVDSMRGTARENSEETVPVYDGHK